MLKHECIFPFLIGFYTLSGTLEIIGSAMSDSKDGGNLWLYLQPEDWREPNWERRVIADKFSPNNYILGNKMSPGKQRLFYPTE